MGKNKGLIILGVLLILFSVSHLIPITPADNPPVEGQVEAPPQVRDLLRGACWDCHSNETVWPWYSHVVPAKWLVRSHVNEGREHLNFSTWNRYSADERARALEEIAEVLEEGEMPLPMYVWLHPEADLSPEEIRLILGWAGEEEASEGR